MKYCSLIYLVISLFFISDVKSVKSTSDQWEPFTCKSKYSLYVVGKLFCNLTTPTQTKNECFLYNVGMAKIQSLELFCDKKKNMQHLVVVNCSEDGDEPPQLPIIWEEINNIKSYHVRSCKRLDYISRNDFENLTKLEVLKIENTSIANIASNVFDLIKNSLKVLHLMNNKLKELDEGVFRNLPSLTTFHLRDENLSELPPGFLEKSVDLNNIRIVINKTKSLKLDYHRLFKCNQVQVNISNNCHDQDKKILAVDVSPSYNEEKMSSASSIKITYRVFNNLCKKSKHHQESDEIIACVENLVKLCIIAVSIFTFLLIDLAMAVIIIAYHVSKF